ncbi:Arylsulfatase A [Nonlabens sp. Hel1_33_55]|uniref:sulfatase n=1 Tax=Nonlabens sp. Hel1_33_55 TaxID=1336802 RepID=UPI000875B466|nr:sulfatase [Nonlabens sp. Hel1_33_55]SCX99659.1 Arylsulfatase A [Nonlabens sp. Hel1_33_55]
MKPILKLVAVFFAAIFAGCNAQQVFAQESSSSSDQKNILFIAVDDLKPLLSNYGESQMVTPNFDRLAKMGVTFTNAHVQYAVCGPSRASVMTGTNPDRTKVWDLHTDFRESAPDLVSMPEYLISQGYATTAVGKIYHKGSSAPGHDGKSWSIDYTLPDNYPEAYGEPLFSYYQDPENKMKYEAILKEAEAKGIKRNGKLRNFAFKKFKPSTEGADVPDNAYQDGLYTQTALAKINQLEEGDKPWFLGVGFQKPHLPFVAPKKYWDLYDRDEIELAAFQQLSEGTPEFAFHSFGELRAFSDINNKLRQGDVLPEEKQRELIHGYMACISYIDAQLGKLLDELDARKITDDTVIVLWGDHGFHLGDHTEWCKHSNFEQATRIPFMFAGPGVQKDKMESTPVNLVDLFPTVFELAGVQQSTQTDGKSLAPLLDEDPQTQIGVDYAYFQYRRGNRMGYGIRTDRYRYTEWLGDNWRSTQTYDADLIQGRELYDYKLDPLETKNFAKDDAYKAVMKDLRERLLSHLANGKK